MRSFPTPIAGQQPARPVTPQIAVDFREKFRQLSSVNDEPHRPSLMDLVTKGEELLKGRPFCDKMLNDQTALVFLAKMQEQGIEVSVEMAEQCFRRMQIAIDTGIYPDALLRRVVSSEQRLDGMVGSPDVLTDR